MQYRLSNALASDEARKFIEILKNCEFQVYRAGRIHWDFIQEKLQKQGVDKFHAHLKAPHSALAADPTNDVLGARAKGFKHRWKEIYQIKRCLESLKLIRPPKDGKDDRHHIPGLEDGFQTFIELKALVLGDITLSKDDLPVRTESLISRKGPVLILSMLARDVWDHIQGEEVLSKMSGRKRIT
jgi:hypothetical protein